MWLGLTLLLYCCTDSLYRSLDRNSVFCARQLIHQSQFACSISIRIVLDNHQQTFARRFHFVAGGNLFFGRLGTSAILARAQRLRRTLPVPVPWFLLLIPLQVVIDHNVSAWFSTFAHTSTLLFSQQTIIRAADQWYPTTILQ